MKALVIVDVQKDFCEGGSLAVEGGNKVARDIRDYVSFRANEYELILFTKDWHAPWPSTNGGHFSETPDYVDSWPIHCVADTEGAEFHDVIEPLPGTWGYDSIYYKGNGTPGYSGAEAWNTGGYNLVNDLLFFGPEQVDIVGIAGDYCVKATALDIKAAGLTVKVLPAMVASVGGQEATDDLIRLLEN